RLREGSRKTCTSALYRAGDRLRGTPNSFGRDRSTVYVRANSQPTTSIDGNGLRGWQAGAPTLVPRERHTASGDHHDPCQRPRIGEGIEDQPTRERGPDQLRVRERCDRRGRRQLESADEQQVPDETHEADSDEKNEIGGGIPRVVVKKRHDRGS